MHFGVKQSGTRTWSWHHGTFECPMWKTAPSATSPDVIRVQEVLYPMHSMMVQADHEGSAHEVMLRPLSVCCSSDMPAPGTMGACLVQWVRAGAMGVCVRREVAKAVRLRKACTVVVAPNIEHIEAEGGLDDLLTSILTQAEANSIPIVFALSRKKLGQVGSRQWLAAGCPARSCSIGICVRRACWQRSAGCMMRVQIKAPVAGHAVCC